MSFTTTTTFREVRTPYGSVILVPLDCTAEENAEAESYAASITKIEEEDNERRKKDGIPSALECARRRCGSFARSRTGQVSLPEDVTTDHYTLTREQLQRRIAEKKVTLPCYDITKADVIAAYPCLPPIDHSASPVASASDFRSLRFLNLAGGDAEYEVITTEEATEPITVDGHLELKSVQVTGGKVLISE